jgi:hypothetical protein
MALNKYDKKAKAYARKAKLFTNTLKKTMTDEDLLHHLDVLHLSFRWGYCICLYSSL